MLTDGTNNQLKNGVPVSSTKDPVSTLSQKNGLCLGLARVHCSWFCLRCSVPSLFLPQAHLYQDVTVLRLTLLFADTALCLCPLPASRPPGQLRAIPFRVKACLRSFHFFSTKVSLVCLVLGLSLFWSACCALLLMDMLPLMRKTICRIELEPKMVFPTGRNTILVMLPLGPLWQEHCWHEPV